MKPLNSWHFPATFLVLTLFVPGARAQSQPDEISSLKKEIGTLRAEINFLKKEIALLKASSLHPGRAVFSARFDAASAVGNAFEREKAFAKLAVDAAKGGEPKVVKKSLESINNAALRADCAYKAALFLAHAGEGEEALAIAKALSDAFRREAALLKMAKGEVED